MTTTRNALKKALLLSSVYFLAELLGGLWTGSLALIADSGHMAVDVLALSLSFWALREKEHNHDSKIETKIALINSMSLILVALGIFAEAYDRFNTPIEIKGLETILIALGGLIINYISAKFLEPHQHHNVNVRSAWLHVYSDMLGSVAVIISSACILLFQWNAADPIFSVLIGIIILFNGLKLLKEIKGAS